MPFPAHPIRPLSLPQRRARGLPDPDVVTFVAACPACGRDCEWTEERRDTRVKIIIACDCRKRPPAPRQAVRSPSPTGR
ncbi:MAG: hypothetical protein QG608_2824 [Actinomycetota bacterium]|nr:hypothetical protein [Actinomycetota bacterium]